MNHAHTPPSAARSARPDNTRWTGERASTFLRLLARSGKVAPCAEAVGMSRQSAYRLRARAPRFAEFWDMAMEQAAALRASSRRVRGVRGVRKQVHPLLAKGAPAAPDQGDTPGPQA